MNLPPEALKPDTRPRETAAPGKSGAALSICLDLPMPPSTNRIWRYTGRRMHKSEEYMEWLNAADMYVISTRQFPKQKIHGPFRCIIELNNDLRGSSDGDNRIKAVLDWCQSREIIRNDGDCVGGKWTWVSPAAAPEGCRIILWSVPDVAME
jgi:Holliday junction resolvase RusA-like endonuclease